MRAPRSIQRHNNNNISVIAKNYKASESSSDE